LNTPGLVGLVGFIGFASMDAIGHSADFLMPSTIRNSLVWIFEAFDRDPTFLTKRMFGCDAAYIDGRLCLVVADRGESWSGLLICTAHASHASLIQEMPALQVHPVLGKWLYSPQGDAEFETVVGQVTSLVLARDERIGVEPRPRRQK